MLRELTSRVTKTTWSGIFVSSSIKLMKSGVSYIWYKFKTSRKKCNLIVRANFIGEIFKMYISRFVLLCCTLKRF